MKLPSRFRRLFRFRSREERPSRMVLTVTEDTPADMLAGSMELLVQLPRDHHLHTQKVTVQRSTPMMDLLVQIATAHKLAASSYTLQAIGERGMVLPHQPNTPIGALDALQVKLLPKQGTFIPRKTKQANQPFETTFRLQVHLPRNQLYVSRVSPKMNLGDILDEVCREKNLDRNKYELRHPANLEETLDLSLSLQDYHLQEVTLYAKQGRTLGSALSTQDIMALQRQEERRRQQAKQGVFGFIFKKSKEGSLSTDSLGGRSTSPARSDETARSTSPLQPPARPQRKRRPAPKPPIQNPVAEENVQDSGKDKVVISHSRNSSDSSGYHEASVLSDNPDSAGRLPETLPRRNRAPGGSMDTPRKLVQTSQSSKSLGNLATVSGTLSHGISTTSLSSTGLRKKRAAPPPPATRPLSSAISTQGLERIVDSEESLTSDMDPSKPPSDIGASSKASSDIEERPKASSDIGISTVSQLSIDTKLEFKSNSSTGSENPSRPGSIDVAQAEVPSTVTETTNVETARVMPKRGNRENGPIDTEVLLQKVSDTLSNRLPSEEVSTESQKKNQMQTESTSTAKSVDSMPTIGKSPPTSEEVSERGGKDCVDRPAEGVLNNSTGSGTVVSQQDTSDYVSAVDEDLSIPDWEYQLPAPPSAFRDTASPVFNDYDTITLGSVEAFKEPIAHIVDEDTGSEQKAGEKQELGKPVRSGEAKSARSGKMEKDEKIADVREKDEGRGIIRDRKVSEDQIVIENAKVTESRKVTEDRKFTEDRKLAESNNRAERKEEKASAPLSLEDNNKRAEEKPVKLLKKSEPSLELKKEVINELETKLVSGALPQGKDGDSRRVESISTPKVAPVDNTLSNFTITTYSRQKSLDIFDETDKSSSTNKISDERFMKSFPTLTRNRFAHESEIGTRDSTLSMLQSKRSSLKDDYASLGDVQLRKEPKIREDVQRVMENRGNEKVTVQRSRSYISAPENSRQDARDTEDYESNSVSLGGTDAGIKKSNSVRNLNPNGPKFNEKFSQWRENILKKQEEPTKEKQLQSLQVLKSILPQLKNAQQAEENVPKENGTALPEEKRSETRSNEHSAESNVVLTPESQPLRTEKQSEVESRKINTEKNAAKRYTYTGPPAISLGSWSERPSVNVQIKMDTDYKFGGAKWNTSNSRTIVTINGTTDETDSPKVSSNIEKLSGNKIESVSEKKASNELAKKLISHTTASGFKKPVQHSTHSSGPKGPIDKPIVTGVELKKSINEKNEVKSNNNTIDTSPVNFRELSKAFGQDVCLRPKPKRLNPNRRSEYLESDAQAQNIDSSIKQNGHSEMANSNLVTENQNNLRPKRFTSVVGITQSNNVSHSTSFPFRAGTNIKTNITAPVIKGFKLAGPTTNSLSEKLQKIPNGIPNENGSIPQPPKPSTMPVITGVTLKSASSRPKSMPVQIDPRDSLLESIRNFGGRGNLKSAAKKC